MTARVLSARTNTPPRAVTNRSSQNAAMRFSGAWTLGSGWLMKSVPLEVKLRNPFVQIRNEAKVVP